MSDLSYWWRESRSPFLNEALSFINSSRCRDDAIARCDDLCKALNKFWNDFFDYRDHRDELTESEREKGRSDAQAFRQLLLAGMSPEQKIEFIRTDNLRKLAEFTPQIMNHDALTRNRYDPMDISDQLRRKASEEHKEFMNAHRRVLDTTGDAVVPDALLQKTATLLYVVRSNIAHSEKTPRGPDLDKAKRDRVVSEITAEVIDDLCDILLGHPSCHLAVYGTLAPGEPNASILDGIEGDWREATVDGEVGERHGFPMFFWRQGRESVRARVFHAPRLKDEFDRLDKFEGPQYRRILVPVEVGSEVLVCNIYEGTDGS